MTKILLVIERDLRSLMHQYSILIMRWFFVVVQIGIFGLAISRIVTAMQDYYYYYAMGVIVMTMYSVAIFTGYEIYDEADDGFTEYLLALPITRRELVLGRSLAGGLRSFIFMAPVIAGFMILIGIVDPLRVAAALVALYGFAFGVSGLSITLAVGLRSGDSFDIVMGALDAFIVRLSSALYPQAFMPASISVLSRFNPLTYASDLFRWSLNFDPQFLANPVTAMVVLIIFLVLFNLTGVAIYERSLEGGAWK
jgi:ABC-2 type transport system permease protein